MKKFIVRATVDVPVWIQDGQPTQTAIDAINQMLVADYGLDLGGESQVIYEEYIPDEIPEGSI